MHAQDFLYLLEEKHGFKESNGEYSGEYCAEFVNIQICENCEELWDKRNFDKIKHLIPGGWLVFCCDCEEREVD